MSERTGLLTKEHEKFLGTWLDQKIKFKNPIIEATDGTIFTYVVRGIDDLLLEKIPQNWQSPLEIMIDHLMNKDVNAALNVAADIINDAVDIPFLDEEAEEELLVSTMKLIASLVMKYSEK